MKEQQIQLDHDRERAALDHEYVIREQEALRWLNKQLQAQVANLQNNSAQTEVDPENNRSSSLYALDKLIQKQIKEAKLPHHQIVHCWALRRYLEELIQQSLLKEYVLTPKAAFGQSHPQPS